MRTLRLYSAIYRRKMEILKNGLVAEDLAAALGVESSSSDEEKISEEKNESSVEQRLDELEQLITMMHIQREQRRREDQEVAARRMEISERRAAEDRILLERLTNKTKILEVKVCLLYTSPSPRD